MSEDISGLIRAINRARKYLSRDKLRFSPRLASSAKSWSLYLASSGKLDHGDFFGRISEVFPEYENSAENLAMVGANSEPMSVNVDSVVEMWLSDPQHRTNMLGDYNFGGVGLSKDASGVSYWVLDLVKAERDAT